MDGHGVGCGSAEDGQGYGSIGSDKIIVAAVVAFPGLEVVKMAEGVEVMT